MLEDYLRFCREVRCLKEKTIKEYFYIIKTMGKFLDFLHPGDQSEIERKIIEARDSGTVKWSQQYTAKVSIVLLSYFRWLSSENLIPFNPYIVNRFKKPRPKEPEYLTQKEFDFIVANPHLTHQDRTLLNLAWDSGVRKSELLAFEQDDFDLKDCLAKVRTSKGNYSDGRIVPFTKKTGNLLKEQFHFLREHDVLKFVFVDSEWNRLGDSACDKRIREISFMRVKDHDTIPFHLHTLRHSFANRALAAGLPQLTVMKILGHSSLAMTNLYLHLSHKDIKQAYERLITC